jgi:hypothetical protein
MRAHYVAHEQQPGGAECGDDPGEHTDDDERRPQLRGVLHAEQEMPRHAERGHTGNDEHRDERGDGGPRCEPRAGSGSSK